MEFEWDERKARDNLAKHGVTFSLATEVFDDPRLVLAADAAHSRNESRYFAFGRVGAGVLTVRFAVRGERMRIIGADIGGRERHSMSKRIVYTDEPIKIGRRVGREVLPGHGGPRAGAGRPSTGNEPITLRLPPRLLATVRRDAKRAGQTLSQYVAARLQRPG